MRIGRTERFVLATVAMALLPVQAFGQETTTYTYDALGRVISVQHSGGRLTAPRRRTATTPPAIERT
jgi:YD repeat-containing protein